MASSWAWVMVPLATSGSRADLAQSPLGVVEPAAGAAGAGAGVVVVSPPVAAVVSVVELVAGSVTAPESVAAEESVLLVTSAIRVVARVVPLSARPAAPPPSSPAVRPYTARRRDFIGGRVL